ncbi:MAG: hypothetical protein ACYC9S_05000 [Leptospirales bacterium]
MAKRKIPRFFLSRLLFAVAGFMMAGGLFLFFLMLSAETNALDRAHRLNLVAMARLNSLMNARHPEQVPIQIREISSNMGGRTTLLDPRGKPAYRNTRTLNKMQSFSRIPETWFKTPHGPFLFPWPPDGVPEQLAEQVSRISGAHGAKHLLTNREGTPSPLQPVGGFASWSTPIPNATSCAQCHGFDSEVLGYMVTFVPVPSVLPDHRGQSAWGFWPLPGLNQKIVFSIALGAIGILFAGLVFFDEGWVRRAVRRESEKTAKGSGESSQKGSGPQKISKGGVVPLQQGQIEQIDQLTMDPGEKSALASRLFTLDQKIGKEIDLLPHAGIQPPFDLEAEERKHELLDRSSSWSDQVEMLLMDLKSLKTNRTDPLLDRSIQTLEKLKNEALQINGQLEDLSLESHRLSPPYESLADREKAWIEELRTALGHLHAEVRAILGMLRSLPASPADGGKE